MTDELVRERRGPVLIARLNRPEKRNALTGEMLRGIGGAIVEAETDPEIRVVVLTGTGDRAFCAGMDLKAFAESDGMALGDDDETQGFFRLIQGRVAIPLVGAANGTALAGGFELLLACDVIVASSDAEFGLPEVKRGLFPAGGGTLLGQRMALGIALELILTGASISASRAHDLGLVNTLVASDDVLASAVAVAEQIGANGPLAVQAAKELVRLGVSDPTRSWDRLSEWQDVVFTSEDAQEGATAFVEKRPPVWQGR